MKLHEAIDQVLADHPAGLLPKEIADEINRRDLYAKPSDGQPVPPNQISARVGNKTYRDRYEKDVDGRIKRVGSTTEAPGEVAERGFVGKMLAAMSEKYGLRRKPSPSEMGLTGHQSWNRYRFTLSCCSG